MLFLLVGPSCSGESTLIAARLASRRLPSSHGRLARDLGRFTPEALHHLVASVDPLYVHFSCDRLPSGLGGGQQAFLDRLLATPRSKAALVLLADVATLEERSRRRGVVEPILRPASNGRVPRGAGLCFDDFDPGAFAAAWTAEFRARSLPCRVLDTRAWPSPHPDGPQRYPAFCSTTP